jgi:hypothetical protein
VVPIFTWALTLVLIKNNVIINLFSILFCYLLFVITPNKSNTKSSILEAPNREGVGAREGAVTETREI